ncbi:MAG: hypothetical protein ACI4GD_05760 [Lachnospiraceae bacterium]
MDIKEQITQVVNTITNDKSLLEKFQKDPVKVVEGILKIDLPDDIINKIITGVKGKISVDQVSGAVDALKKLF